MALTTQLIVKLVVRMVLGIALFVALIFGAAGTWDFWPGWVFCATLFTPMLLAAIYLGAKDPELLERRMKTREPEAQQRVIIAVANIVFILVFLLPGIDHRFGWSSLPPALIVAADALVVTGYMLCLWVMKTNSYAARTVEVEQEQQLIDSGPYAYVRHPMYSGVVLMMLATGPALDSLWTLIPAALVPVVLGFRLRNEEQLLCEQLDGYREYRERVRFRLLPGIW